MKPTTGIAVDASCRSGLHAQATGVVEWRGIDLATGKEIFHSPVYPEGTISMGESMAILDGVKWAMDHGYAGPIYSDSETAIAWCKHPATPPRMVPTEANRPLLELVRSDMGWAELPEVFECLQQVKKWKTREWGENPADLGYKKYQKVSVWAVTCGRTPGLYHSWSECAREVCGFPDSAFKRFPKAKKQQAEAYLRSQPRLSPKSLARHLVKTHTGTHLTSCQQERCIYPRCACGTTPKP